MSSNVQSFGPNIVVKCCNSAVQPLLTDVIVFHGLIIAFVLLEKMFFMELKLTNFCFIVMVEIKVRQKSEIENI